jgi:hypothetical protein
VKLSHKTPSNCTRLFTIIFLTLGFQTNKTKIKMPCRQFKMSVTWKSAVRPFFWLLVAHDIISTIHVTPITINRRRYRKNLTIFLASYKEQNCFKFFYLPRTFLINFWMLFAIAICENWSFFLHLMNLIRSYWIEECIENQQNRDRNINVDELYKFILLNPTQIFTDSDFKVIRNECDIVQCKNYTCSQQGYSKRVKTISSKSYALNFFYPQFARKIILISSGMFKKN